MSRIGNQIITIPQTVNISVTNDKLLITGPFGTLSRSYKPFLIKINLPYLSIINPLHSNQSKKFHGLLKVLVQNMIIGVSQKFSKTIIAEGIGYKFQIENTKLIILAGYSHLITFSIPNYLELKLESNIKLIITGVEKEKIGAFAAIIRAIRPPEPYKGKGFFYENEKIIKKIGKSAKKNNSKQTKTSK